MDNINQANDLADLADTIRSQANSLRIDAFLSFMHTSDIMNRFLDIEFATRLRASRTGIGILHFLVLHGGKMKPTDLSKLLFRSKHTVTRVVDTLEKQGLVRREPIGKDRRNREVSITRKGVQFVARETNENSQRISNTVFHVLDPDEISELKVILRKLRRNLLKVIQTKT